MSAAVLLFALAAAALAAAYTYEKYRAMGFDTVDYSFYLASTERLGHREMPQELAINPHGYNVLRFYGTEGERGINQSIHFEPLKYLGALILRLWDSPVPLFVLLALACISPVAYAALLWRGSPWLLGAFAAAWVFNPLLYLSAANDLRPFTLLAPLFLLAFLSTHFERPRREQIFFFCALLVVREEALLLGAALAALVALRQGVRAAAPFAYAWAAWAAVTAGYFMWTGYPNNLLDAATHHAALSLAAGVLAAACAAATLWSLWRVKNPALLSTFVLPALAALVAVQVVRLAQGSPLPPQYLLFYHPQAWLLWAVLIAFILDAARGSGAQRRTAYGFGIVAAVFALFCFVTPYAPAQAWQAYQAQAPAATFVFDAAARLPVDAVVLADLSTFQPLYRFGRAYAYERLPASLAPEAAGYPDNVALLGSLLKNSVGYVLISRASEPDLAPLMRRSGVRYDEVASSTQFVLFKARR